MKLDMLGEGCLPNMRGYDIAMVGIGMSKNVLDQIIAVLIARNWDQGKYFSHSSQGQHTIDQRNTGAISASLTNTLEITL